MSKVTLRTPFILLALGALAGHARDAAAQELTTPDAPAAPPPRAPDPPPAQVGQDGQPPPALETTGAELPPPEEPPKLDEPVARSRFEASFSIGYAVPAGSATGYAGDGLGSTFSAQVPLTIAVGVDVLPPLFIGLYGTFAPGGVASQAATSCQNPGVSCSASSLHGGLLAEYRVQTSGKATPWIGYGFGFENNTATFSSSNSGETASLEARGWEFARLRGGVDWLPDPLFGFGLFVDVGIGEYERLRGSGPLSTDNFDSDIGNKALHEWVTFGARARLMP